MSDRGSWIWMPHVGHVGHLVVGYYCQFHLTTEVGGYIVSTVGEYPPKAEGNFEEIAPGCTYETMVFRSVRDGPLCCPFLAFGHEHDIRGYNDAGFAAAGHVETCEKWSVAGSSK